MGEQKDTYLTIAPNPPIGEFKDKGSKFLGYAQCVSTAEEIKTFLNEIREIHPKATHHCYAWRLGQSKDQYRMQDDGEPSGTAGKPILGQIDSKKLTNIMVINVRYYGGTKLGVPGLINAYKNTTLITLDGAKVIEVTIQDYFELSYNYELMNVVMRIVKKHNAQVVKQKFEMTCQLYISIRKSESETLRTALEQIHLLNTKFLYTA